MQENWENMQENDRQITHHTSNVYVHYLVKVWWVFEYERSDDAFEMQ